MSAIPYRLPTNWIKYDHDAVAHDLTNAKANILALKAIPFQRRWVKDIQEIQLKMEVAGTSQIEGADFAANELEIAMKSVSPQQLITRSQKQASAATRTYRWIADIPEDAVYVDTETSFVEQKELWDVPILFMMLVVLLSGEWLWRKRKGLA